MAVRRSTLGAYIDRVDAAYRSHLAWKTVGAELGWRMPAISRWQRLPIVRFWVAIGYGFKLGIRAAKWEPRLPPGHEYDVWVFAGLKRGWWHGDH